MLITFEGIDGSGKTTQALKVFNYLKEKGINVHLFRDPGGTDIGDQIRNLLMNYDLDPITELLLFEASRSELVRRIRPLLKEGSVVILDRFTDSTLAYQGYGRGMDLDLIRTLNDLVTGGLRPDLTFLLDVDPEVALGRVRDRSRFDDPDLLRRVREGYLKIAEEEPERFVVLDSSLPEEKVFKRIVTVLETRF